MRYGSSPNSISLKLPIGCQKTIFDRYPSYTLIYVFQRQREKVNSFTRLSFLFSRRIYISSRPNFIRNLLLTRKCNFIVVPCFYCSGVISILFLSVPFCCSKTWMTKKKDNINLQGVSVSGKISYKIKEWTLQKKRTKYLVVNYRRLSLFYHRKFMGIIYQRIPLSIHEPTQTVIRSLQLL